MIEIISPDNLETRKHETIVCYHLQIRLYTELRDCMNKHMIVVHVDLFNTIYQMSHNKKMASPKYIDFTLFHDDK